MKYPTDIVDHSDGEWGRIHCGHNLNREMLRADLDQFTGPQPAGHSLHTQEVFFAYVPRVKWCADYGGPCDQEGDWHAHWYSVRPGNPNYAFTVATWRKEPAGA